MTVKGQGAGGHLEPDTEEGPLRTAALSPGGSQAGGEDLTGWGGGGGSLSHEPSGKPSGGVENAPGLAPALLLAPGVALGKGQTLLNHSFLKTKGLLYICHFYPLGSLSSNSFGNVKPLPRNVLLHPEFSTSVSSITLAFLP